MNAVIIAQGESKRGVATLRKSAAASGNTVCLLVALFVFAWATACPQLHAQTKPDTLLLTSGETLEGQLESATSGSVTFKSTALGEVTIDWTKIKQLDAHETFAVLRKEVKLQKHQNVSAIPQGAIFMTAQVVTVTPASGSAQTIPVSDIAHIVTQADFHQAVTRSPGIFQQWKGAVTGGASVIEATQHSVSFNAAVSLARVIPSQTWLQPRNRTAVAFSTAYGKLSEPGTPTVKTSIYSAAVERDEYFTPQLYGLGKAEFDHNFSQGLDLQQIYGGGVGWTVIRAANQTLDVQALVDYERQSFQVPSQNQNLVGSIFAEIFNRTFSDKIVLAQQLSLAPAWNNLNAYSANASVLASFPVYKRFSFTTGVIDAFLNNPPPGFKKNSVQFTVGVSYTLQ